MRYEQAVSEQGFGGKTNEKTGHSIKGDSMPPRDNIVKPILTKLPTDVSGLKAEDGDAVQSRQAQGYGPGSGVGA